MSRSPGGAPIDRRTLNRTLLARQWLTRRSDGTPADVLRHLVAVQAQSPSAPYFGVGTRLTSFRHDDLAGTLLDRSAIRLVNLRGTIHWSLSSDGCALRTWVQESLERGLATAWGSQLGGVDLEKVASAAEDLLGDGSMPVNDLGKALAEMWPDTSPSVLANAARVLTPLVQVPPRGVWGSSGATAYARASAWVGSPNPTAPDAADFVRRYLAAFGPASVRDIQAWSGLTRLASVAKVLEPELRHFTDESGTDLVDLADLELADPDEKTPPLFVAPFDNLILSHADRNRIINDDGRKAIATKNGLIPGTILIDGFVAGTWTVDAEATVKKASRAAPGVVTVTPFSRLAKRTAASLAAPGRAIAGLAGHDAKNSRVVVEEPG
jgi:hypothetical protein